MFSRSGSSQPPPGVPRRSFPARLAPESSESPNLGDQFGFFFRGKLVREPEAALPPLMSKHHIVTCGCRGAALAFHWRSARPVRHALAFSPPGLVQNVHFLPPYSHSSSDLCPFHPDIDLHSAHLSLTQCSSQPAVCFDRVCSLAPRL